jgi:hypothetical protein
MANESKYEQELHIARSLLIVTSLQKRKDIKAKKLISKYQENINWKPLSNLMINESVWSYAVEEQKYDPKLVFCHPNIIIEYPVTSLYYRGLSALSLKSAKSYLGSVDSLEDEKKRNTLTTEKALKVARIYNTFICSNIKSSTDWTLENGYRTIIATLGITLDGAMRNKIGEIAEDRIKISVFEWLKEKDLIDSSGDYKDAIPKKCQLKNSIFMEFSSEPDISFYKDDILLVTVEIKGGIDPAGALERYGAATKSFRHAIKSSPRCKNYYLGAVNTPELERRINDDRLVEKYFSIIGILSDPKIRELFYNELFHHCLRLI